MSDTLRFRRADLLARLKTNREQHAKDYDEATVVYRRDLIAVLQAKVKDAEAGKDVYPFTMPNKPEQHLGDYDTHLAMYEMTTAEEIELDVASFQQLVLDKWEWARSFASNTKSYIGK